MPRRNWLINSMVFIFVQFVYFIYFDFHFCVLGAFFSLVFFVSKKEKKEHKMGDLAGIGREENMIKI